MTGSYRPFAVPRIHPDREGMQAIENAHMYARLSWMVEANSNANVWDRKLNADHYAWQAELFYRRAYWYRLTGTIYAPAPANGLGIPANLPDLDEWLLIAERNPDLRNAVVKFLGVYECDNPFKREKVLRAIFRWIVPPTLERVMEALQWES